MTVPLMILAVLSVIGGWIRLARNRSAAGPVWAISGARYVITDNEGQAEK